MLRDLPLFDQLVQDVLDLLPRPRRRIEILENPLEIRPALDRLPNISQQVFFIKIGLTLPSGATASRLPPAHTSSLLTSQIEEHRFEILSRNGGIGRRARFRF